MQPDPQLLSRAIDSVADPVVVTDPSGTIQFVNAAFTRENGHAASEVVGQTPRVLKSGQTPSETYEQLWATVTAGRTWAGEVVNRRKDGSVYLAELTVVPILGAGRELVCMVATHRNITERRRAETSLRTAEASFRAVIEHSPDAVVVHRTGLVLYANPAAEALLGAPSRGALRGRSMSDVISFGPGSAAGGPVEARLKSPWGPERILEVTSVPLSYEGGPATLQMLREVTEQRRLTERMMLVDRMVAIGTLAAGVGHEINNPLSFLIANLDFSRTTLPEVLASLREPRTSAAALEQLQEIDAALAEALEGAARVRAIVRDLARFARASDDDLGPVDLSAALELALTMVAGGLAKRARLVKTIDATHMAWGSLSRVGQVLLNLLQNAIEAIPAGAVDSNEIRCRTFDDDGDRVVIEIADTGVGIAPDVASRIFDPFFTTRPVGQGKGLGLSVALALARGMGGDLTVQTEPGKGSAFRLSLPTEPPAAHATATSSGESQQGAPGKQPRVLLMDDDPQLFDQLERLLATRASVSLARSPAEVFARLDQAEAFDLILWDVTRTRLEGAHGFLELSERFPAAASRVFFLAGGVAPSSVQQLLGRFPTRRLERPLSPTHIVEIVDQLALRRPGAEA